MADIIIYVFDILKQRVNQVEQEISDLKHKVKPDSIFLLVGNKMDELTESPQQVTKLFNSDFVN